MNADLPQRLGRAPRDACETWPRERIEAFQLAQLKRQLVHVGTTSLYYRRLFKEIGFDPAGFDRLADIGRLPLTRKRDYVASIERLPPYGEFVAAGATEVRRIHFSSGTTSKPAPQFWTAFDLDRWADLYARYAHAQGVGPGDVYQCLFGFAWFVGGLGGMAGYQRLGATCIPSGNQDTERQIRSIFEYGVTALTGTPSFVAYLADSARSMGFDPRESKVRTIMLGGEPGAGIAATRTRLQAEWDAACYDGYGSLEFQPIGWECHERQGPHLAEDFVYAEVLDEAGSPCAEGVPGVLVLTHLDKQAGPLVRWWTGDVVVRDSSPCACGRTHARLVGGVRGRADDMLVIRGVNLFPSAVEEVVRSFARLTPEYQIVLNDSVRDAAGFLTGIHLRVERADASVPPQIADDLTREIRARLQVRATVELLQPGSLPRNTHKAKRVVREDGSR